MAVEMDQVRAALEPEEPDYRGSVEKLGVDALPHLERIVTGDHTGLAAKAAYLAGLIGTDQCMPALNKAAASGQAAVRVAAAAAAKHLPGGYCESLVGRLIDDADMGVRKVAMRSAPPQDSISESLRARIAAYGGYAVGGPAATGTTGAKKSASKEEP
jgi:hypothetical protein